MKLMVKVFNNTKCSPRRRKELLGLTSHNELKLRWVRSLTRKEIIDLLKLMNNMKSKYEILSMLDQPIADTVVGKIIEDNQ